MSSPHGAHASDVHDAERLPRRKPELESRAPPPPPLESRPPPPPPLKGCPSLLVRREEVTGRPPPLVVRREEELDRRVEELDRRAEELDRRAEVLDRRAEELDRRDEVRVGGERDAAGEREPRPKAPAEEAWLLLRAGGEDGEMGSHAPDGGAWPSVEATWLSSGASPPQSSKDPNDESRANDELRAESRAESRAEARSDADGRCCERRRAESSARAARRDAGD
eukprot:658491-Prymnesium_polylepis.1